MYSKEINDSQKNRCKSRITEIKLHSNDPLTWIDVPKEPLYRS